MKVPAINQIMKELLPAGQSIDIINAYKRRSVRLKEYDYSSLGEYFITICTKDKECLFGEIADEEVKLSSIGRIAERCWEEIPEHFDNVELGEFENRMPRIRGSNLKPPAAQSYARDYYCSSTSRGS